MSRKARILLLEDNPEDAELVARLLAGGGLSCEIRRVDSREGYTAALSEGPFDLILSDYGLPGFDGSAALALAHSLHPETPFIVVSGVIGEDLAIDMLRRGATDFVLKDRLSRLAPAVERALHEAEEHTVRRRAEEAMHLQREMLLRNEHLEVVASVVAGVAHELNNPLALLMGHATLLKRKAGEGPFADRAEKLMQAADRCSRIMRNFLALARRRPPEREPVDLRRLVRETLEILAYGFRVDGVEVEVDLAEDLPQLPAADPDRLRQVLVNLVINAHHALRQTTGKRRLSVRAQVDPQAPVIRLVVEDNGPGIPADLRERIFEPFFSTKPAGEGTGLGLPLCRTIVQDHGGELRVEGAPGEGARFVVELPFAPAPMEATPSAPGAGPSPGPLTILVVDDEADLAGVMRDALALAGHTADTAVTAAAAFERLRERRYDLVLSDLRMPDMDGPRFHQEVQRLHPELARRFVFVTGDTLSPSTAAFIRSIGAPVLAKPFELEELVRAVSHALGA